MVARPFNDRCIGVRIVAHPIKDFSPMGTRIVAQFNQGFWCVGLRVVAHPNKDFSAFMLA